MFSFSQKARLEPAELGERSGLTPHLCTNVLKYRAPQNGFFSFGSPLKKPTSETKTSRLSLGSFLSLKSCPLVPSHASHKWIGSFSKSGKRLAGPCRRS